MQQDWLTPFVEATELAVQVMSHRTVADRWGEASALEGLTVGGVAAHLYGATRRFELALDEELPDPPKVVRLPDFYGHNRIDDRSDLDAGWHPLLREDAEKRASYGPEAVSQRFRDLVSRLTDRLPGEAPERLVPIWTIAGGVTPLSMYVVTRVVELVVHSDDLAASVDLPPLAVPPAAASTALAAFVDMARHRSGDLAVVRAFARRERSDADVLRVL